MRSDFDNLQGFRTARAAGCARFVVSLSYQRNVLRFAVIIIGLLMLGSITVSHAGSSDGTNNPAGSIENPMSLQALTARNNLDDLGDWIWDKKTFDRQTVRFWNTLVIPEGAKIKTARLRLTVDNSFTLYLDGYEIGRGDEWRDLFEFDLVKVLTPGIHVIGVEAYNSSELAAMVFGMRVELADGRVIQLKSGQNWRIAPDNARHWERQRHADTAWPHATVLPDDVKLVWVYYAWKGTGMQWPEWVNRVPTLAPIIIPFWKQSWFQFMLLTISIVAIVVSIRLMAKLGLHAKEQGLLKDERARIAKDIHDDVGARITHLVLEGEVGASEALPGSTAQKIFNRISEEGRETLSAMDEILWALNPQQDSIRNFASYICRFAQSFFKSSQIQCLLDVDENLSGVAFNLHLRRSLFFAVKESLRNVISHSNATEVTLSIHRRGEILVVVVQDNGQGFDLEQINPERNGLSNMALRMREMGGDCRIEAPKGRGCRVEFSMPLTQVQRPPWWLKAWRKNQASH